MSKSVKKVTIKILTGNYLYGKCTYNVGDELEVPEEKAIVLQRRGKAEIVKAKGKK